MNITHLIQSAIKKIIASDSTALDSEVLLSFVIKKSKEFLLAHPEFEPTKKQISQFKKLTAKRAKGEPVAYLIGHKEFYGLNFEVNKNTLIPRPETELIVEEVIADINKYKKNILIDVGTGSGCIPIAILKNTKQVKCFAIDISHQALAVAKRNAKKYDVKIKFLRGNLLEPMANQLKSTNGQKIIITANLPYLTAKQYRENPTLRFEPKSALVAKKSGLALYEKLLKQISTCHSRFRGNDNRVALTIFLEIDPSQGRGIEKIIKKYLWQAKVKIKNDYAGKKRLVIIDCQL